MRAYDYVYAQMRGLAALRDTRDSDYLDLLARLDGDVVATAIDVARRRLSSHVRDEVTRQIIADAASIVAASVWWRANARQGGRSSKLDSIVRELMHSGPGGRLAVSRSHDWWELRYHAAIAICESLGFPAPAAATWTQIRTHYHHKRRRPE